MYLKELTINGFKSFAKKSELEFSTPITSIVGPNGSGKSNVAEAFRFVLGEQSVKSLRGKRGEDLIWGGSEGVSRGNRAAVSVLFDNSSRLLPLDFDEVKIERHVHRDGQNEYFINDTAVRLKDVQELLAAANIGSTGHHIISQGEADRILSASPRERREMIEDALGLNLYQYKKAEAEKKLGKTKENITQVESLRRELAPHLKYLKKQVERVEKSRQVASELAAAYTEYLKREDTYLAVSSDRLALARRTPAAQLQNLKDQLVTAKTVLRNAETNKHTNSLIVAEEALALARKQKTEALKQESAVAGEVAYLERKLAQLATIAHAPKDTTIALSDVRTLVDKLKADVDAVLLREDISLLRRVLKDITTSLTLFIERVTPVTKDQTTELKQELSEVTKKLETLRAALAEAIDREAKAEAAYQHERSLTENDTTKTHDAERQVFQLVEQVREAERALEVIDREAAVIARERDEFKRELQEAVALVKSAAAAYLHQEIVVDGRTLTSEEIAAEDRQVQYERRRQLEKLKIRLEELGQGATDEVVAEYEAAVARDQFLEREITDLATSVTNLESLITDLETQLTERFTSGLSIITSEFHRFFVLMFGGGSAEVKAVRSQVKKSGEEEEAVQDEGMLGVEVAISLPNKRVKGLEMLSGGERALTSIALLFAMSQVQPPPFIILDETDAALDEANSRRYGDMIEALAKKSQLILITHNRETMSRAGILYGVTMGSDGVSKLLSVKFDDALAVAK